MSILHLLAQDSFIMTNQKCISMFGLYEANLIGLFAGISNYNDQVNPDADGWFYVTYDKIQEKLNLTKEKAMKPIENLEKVGILMVRREGIPCRKYFKFNNQKLTDFLLSEKPSSRSGKNPRQGIKKARDKQLDNIGASGRETKDQEVGKADGYKIIPNNNINNNTLLKYDAREESDLFFETFWEKYEPTSDWNGKSGMKGSKTKAKTFFMDLLSKGESPVYIIWGAIAYLEKINGSRQNVHAELFLKNKLWEEFIEAEIKKREKEAQYQQKSAQEERDFSDLQTDPFWLKAKEDLLNSEIPKSWKEYVAGFIYCGKEEKNHIIKVPSKFVRDWLGREYKEIFERIFTKFILVA